MSFRSSDNWVGKDIERTPGGEFPTYLNKCSGCHSGMDAARGAFAFYDFAPYGKVKFLGAVSKKLNSNPLNFSQGHMTTDAKWQHVGWLPINKDAEGHVYEGAKSFVQFFLEAPEFYRCLAKRSKNVMCPHRNFSPSVLNDIAMDTKEKQNLKRLYSRVATEVCLPEN
ncbi:MAG: hypothetical protein NTV34_02755 [Proteobacteria bacterium]|nr:hypothetical protein [Pseudomonadota bacterium]